MVNLEHSDVVEIDTVLIKVASRCNINCNYCYVYNMGDDGWAAMPKRISHDTALSIGRALRELSRAQRRPFAVVLHGGEPLLLGQRKLGQLLDILRLELPRHSISIQTNGILITEAILDICSEYRANLSVSVDGPSYVHDRLRVGHNGEPTHVKVLTGIQRLRQHRDAQFLYSGLLAVIDPESDAADVYRFLKDLGAPSIDFLYRDGNHTELPQGKASNESIEFGSWLARLLDVYLTDLTPPRIRLLDDIMRLILEGSGLKEGAGITDFGILILETDGSVAKNDTLKSTYNGADRFETAWSVHRHDLTAVVNSNEFSRYRSMQRPSSRTCISCPELRVCGGGMPLHRWSNKNGFDNPSIYCADQQFLINHTRKRISEICSAA